MSREIRIAGMVEEAPFVKKRAPALDFLVTLKLFIGLMLESLAAALLVFAGKNLMATRESASLIPIGVYDLTRRFRRRALTFSGMNVLIVRHLPANRDCLFQHHPPH